MLAQLGGHYTRSSTCLEGAPDAHMGSNEVTSGAILADYACNRDTASSEYLILHLIARNYKNQFGIGPFIMKFCAFFAMGGTKQRA